MQHPQRKTPPPIPIEWMREVSEHQRQQRLEELKEEVPMKIRELQGRELVQQEMKETGLIPLTEEELETMELRDLWEHLRQIRNAQNWGGPSLLEFD